MQLRTLLHNIVSIESIPDCEITGIAQDSRSVCSGNLFLAYPGSQKDGRDYIVEAIAKGATAILMEVLPVAYNRFEQISIPIFTKKRLEEHISEIAARFYGYPAQSMLLIGVTGTNGKSSSTHFIARCLAQAKELCGIIGSIHCGIYTPSTTGICLNILKTSHLTTPGAIELQSLLAQFRDHGVRTVVVEVSSHSLKQGRVKHLPFKIAGFTNLTQDHLDYHGTLEDYAESKRKLFMQPQLQYAIFNQDDAYGFKWQQEFSKSLLSVHGYTVQSGRPKRTRFNTSQASILQEGTYQLSAQVKTPWGAGRLINDHLMGVFNLSNLMLTLNVLCILEVPLTESLCCMSQLRPIQGRMERIHQNQDKPLVIIDYAHTPDALQKALAALALSKGKLWCIFGCGGNRDTSKRPLMGAIAEKYADYVVLTQDNPRDESQEKIIQEILTGMQYPKAVRIVMNRAQAILETIQFAQPEDTVLVAGKGHETYQVIQGVSYPFSDHQIAREALVIKG